MTLRSRRRLRVDGMAALHADCGRRRAGTPPAPPTWPRHMRLLVGEIMVDRGRARGGQRVLEDGSSKKKALLCGVSEAISSRVLGDLLCKYVCARENPFFQPCFSGKKDFARGSPVAGGPGSRASESPAHRDQPSAAARTRAHLAPLPSLRDVHGVNCGDFSAS